MAPRFRGDKLMRSDRTLSEVEPAAPPSFPPSLMRAAFAYGGMLLGAVLGIYEAVLLHSGRHHTHLVRSNFGSLIFLAAPLTDVLVIGFVGLVLGFAAEKCSVAGESCAHWFCAAGLGLAGAYAWGVSFVWLWGDKTLSPSLLAFVAIAGGVSVFVLSASVLRKWGHHRAGFARGAGNAWIGGLRIGALAVGVVLAGLVALYEFRGSESVPDPPAQLTGAVGRPNIILITIDAAPADHFSCYGYSRQTTPNVDRLAKRGVRFENAIAPSSWTLPSFASMFTGLFPHQHGADFTSPLPERLPTLAIALKSMGYQTVGFNANLEYGQASVGIARGFDLYDDGSGDLWQNFTQTLFGRTFGKYVYPRFAHPNWPERQNAEEINRKVFHWFRHRTRQPYFLFVNYFDVHFPYFAPGPFPRLFGELPDGVVRRMNGGTSGSGRSALTPVEHASLVAGFDNTLAYTDSQIEALLQVLEKSQDWSNTVVIITSDHGESFGEHDHFGHGWNLSREVVHVPLIILGPGIPAGLCVRSVVGTRKLYGTILGLAGVSTKGSADDPSLQHHWAGRQDSVPGRGAVISELDTRILNSRMQNAYASVTTRQWQWIMDAQGHAQLFDWVKDPQETTDLAGSPQVSGVMKNLEQAFREHVMKSSGPWAGISYLLPMGGGSPQPLEPEQHELLESLPYQ